MEKKRVVWVDQAKGIGIFLVVLGHTLRGLRSAELLADSPAYRFVDSWIYAFHMPLFFLLSGLFAERQVDRPIRVFARERFTGIIYPYLVWSVLEFLFMYGASRSSGKKMSLSELPSMLIDPIHQFWFLYALLLISILYYLLRYFRLGPLATFGVFVALWATQSLPIFGFWRPWLHARMEGLYYALGAVAGKYGWIEKVDHPSSPVLATIVGIGFGLMTWIVMQPWSSQQVPALAMAICGISAAVSLSLLTSRLSASNVLSVLGAASLEIFVAHTIASAGLRIVLQKVLKIQDPTTHLIVGTLGGLILPLLLMWICRRTGTVFLFRLGPASAKAVKSEALLASTTG